MAKIITSTVLNHMRYQTLLLNKFTASLSNHNIVNSIGCTRHIGLKSHYKYSMLQKCSIHNNGRLYNKSGSEMESSSVDLEQEYDKNIFYSFPHMRGMRTLSRMKLYQTGFTIFAIPCMGYSYAVGTASLLQLEMVLGVATFAGIMLYVMSFYFMRVAGYLSLSSDRQTLRVSHLSFWGKKRETYIPMESIVPLSDLPDKPGDAYVKLARYDSKDIFFYTLRYGQLRNKSMFEYVFGPIV